MIAPLSQLDRWQRLLTPPAADPLPDPNELAEALRVKQGRPLLIATLHAVDAFQRGAPLPIDDRLSKPAGRRPAVQGLAVACEVWRAYLAWLGGSVSHERWLAMFLDNLQPTALVFKPTDNPEPWWQAEMMILHALHSFALRSGNREWLEKTLADADFHLREIQPDHATNDPWAIHAYASHPDGNVTAETLLHAGLIQNGGHFGPVAQMLNRDAAAALAAYLDA